MHIRDLHPSASFQISVTRDSINQVQYVIGRHDNKTAYRCIKHIEKRLRWITY